MAGSRVPCISNYLLWLRNHTIKNQRVLRKCSCTICWAGGRLGILGAEQEELRDVPHGPISQCLCVSTRRFSAGLPLWCHCAGVGLSEEATRCGPGKVPPTFY